MDPKYNPATDPNYPTTMDFIPPDLFPVHDGSGVLQTVNFEEYQAMLAAGNVTQPTPDVTTAMQLSDMYDPDQLPKEGGLR